MTINDFEQHIDPTILERGLSYYKNDYVEEVEQVDEGEFSAIVEGTEGYDVYIKLDNKGKLQALTCDCPYDWGPVCKHQVAVLHYIKDAELHLQPANKNSSMGQIRKEVKGMEKQILESLIVGMAKRSRKMRVEILWELGIGE